MGLPSTLKLAWFYLRCTPRPTICCPCSPRPLSQCLHGNVLHNALLPLSFGGHFDTCFPWILIISILPCLPEFTWIGSIYYLSYDLFLKCDLCPGTRWSTSTKTPLGLSTPKSLWMWSIESHHLYICCLSVICTIKIIKTHTHNYFPFAFTVISSHNIASIFYPTFFFFCNWI